MNSEKFTFKSQAWKTIRRNKPVLVSIYILIFFVVIALLAPLIANEKPLYVSYKGNNLFPAFSLKKQVILNSGEVVNYEVPDWDWKGYEKGKIIFAPVPYSPEATDYRNADYVGPNDKQRFGFHYVIFDGMPIQFRHWLGTDKLGRDVLSGLIHGTRISLTIGILSMVIASLIGIFLGAMAGYFGDEHLKTSRGIFWMILPGMVTGYFYAFQTRSFVLKDALQESTLNFFSQFLISLIIFTFVLALFYLFGKLLSTVAFFSKRVFIKVDSIVSRTIEILISLPTLILIISVAAIARPSLINLVIIIGLTFWTDIARLTRAEFLKLRNIEFIEAARALGYSNRRIIFRHALPNGIAPALVAICFGIASVILTESALSFLGIGVPQDMVTWGSLLAQGRENFSAWWLVIFPGFAIFITVTIYNLIGDGLRDALDVKMKS